MGKGFYVCAVFALLWCGLTGLGVYETLRTIARCVDAQRRFVPVDATILDSRLVRAGKRGDRLEVLFSYAAGGGTRGATGPAFGSTSSSFNRGDPAAYPVGSRTTAWVDPERPDVAVLDRRVPDDTWWACLLLQPFLTIGFAFLVGLIRGPFNVRREKAFLREDGFLPRTVPGWGRVASGDVFSIHRPGAAFTAAAAAWGISTFAAAILLGMAAAAFGFRLAVGLPVTLAACGLVSAAFYLRSRRRGGRTVTVDGPGRRVLVGTSTIPWEKVRSLQAIRQVGQGRRGGTIYRGVRLALVDDAGVEHVLNEFAGCEDDVAVAGRIGRHLAGLMKAPFEAKA